MTELLKDLNGFRGSAEVISMHEMLSCASDKSKVFSLKIDVKHVFLSRCAVEPD